MSGTGRNETDACPADRREPDAGGTDWMMSADRMMNADRMKYYERQLALPEIGPEGQARLMAASVLVVGAGGLGSPILYALAGAGIGRIGIVDFDTVSASNLNRQFLYTPDDIDTLKAEQARRRLSAYHPDLTVETYPDPLDLDRALTLFPGYDRIVAAVDRVGTRRIINAACCRLGRTMIDGGVRGLSGYVAEIIPGVTPCFDCLLGYAGRPLDGDGSGTPPGGAAVATGGVIGATAGVIGSLEAMLVIQSLLGLPDPLRGDLFYFEGKTMQTTRVHVERVPGCPICGGLFSPGS